MNRVKLIRCRNFDDVYLGVFPQEKNIGYKMRDCVA